MANCGGHGKSCKDWQVCEASECKDRPCTYTSKTSHSPAICAENGYVLFCGDKSVYYLTSAGHCSSSNPCVVCQDGFGGCSADKEAFCSNHQGVAGEPGQENRPTTCVYGYPSQCYQNIGYICDAGKYYSSSATRCGNSQSCVQCDNGFVGCSDNAEAFCSAKKSKPAYDPNKCQKGHRRCDGRNLVECDGTSYSISVKTCPSYCVDGTGGSNSSCSENIPQCTPKNDSQATVVAWNDGDTTALEPISDGSCSPLDSNTLQKIRFKVRVLGIDAPECSKQMDYTYNMQVCKVDSVYKSTNDPYGYESWEYAMKLFPTGTVVRVTCDETDEYNNCSLDNTNARYLMYLENGGRDFSTGMTAKGLAVPYLHIVPHLTSQEKGICNALLEAMANRRGIWESCTTIDEQCISSATSKLPSAKEDEFKALYGRCQYILSKVP
jgi:endonuclease YncB( thermonuclease family)